MRHHGIWLNTCHKESRPHRHSHLPTLPFPPPHNTSHHITSHHITSQHTLPTTTNHHSPFPHTTPPLILSRSRSRPPSLLPSSAHSLTLRPLRSAQVQRRSLWPVRLRRSVDEVDTVHLSVRGVWAQSAGLQVLARRSQQAAACSATWEVGANDSWVAWRNRATMISAALAGHVAMTPTLPLSRGGAAGLPRDGSSTESLGRWQNEMLRATHWTST